MLSEIRRRKQAPNENVYNYILAKRDLCLELIDGMSDRDMIEPLLQGMKPEIAKMLRTAPSRLEEFIDLAKHIERGIDEFDISGSTETVKTVIEPSSFMKDFVAMLKDVTYRVATPVNTELF